MAMLLLLPLPTSACPCSHCLLHPCGPPLLLCCQFCQTSYGIIAIIVGLTSVTIIVGVVVVGVALQWLLHIVRGGGGGRLGHGDGLEVVAMGLCAARWRQRQQWGLSPAAAGGVGIKGQGMVVWWIACP
ncbi:hypothetical protein EDB89DRAFT_1909492 [Lactarius sanguifluus]|nr:hypothetical protein EDB89DRAFT_1909492 [Lactarius sanguifluus]